MEVRPLRWRRLRIWQPAKSWYLFRAAVPLATAMAALGVLVYTHNVPTRLTADDRRYIPLILHDGGHGDLARRRPQAYQDQIEAIAAVQDAVLRIAPDQASIPLEHAR